MKRLQLMNSKQLNVQMQINDFDFVLDLVYLEFASLTMA